MPPPPLPPPLELGVGFRATFMDAGVDWPVLALSQVSVNVRLNGDATTTASVIAALPLVARAVPVQPSSVPPPLAMHAVALAEVQVSVVDWPEAIVVGDAVRDTVSAGQLTTTET